MHLSLRASSLKLAISLFLLNLSKFAVSENKKNMILLIINLKIKVKLATRPKCRVCGTKKHQFEDGEWF